MVITADSDSEGPINATPHLIVEIKDGWELDPDGERFCSESGKIVVIKKGLPPSTRVVRRVPQLANKPRNKLSDDELDLLKYFNVLLPNKSDPADYVDLIKGWACSERVDLPPEYGLPGAPPM